MSITLSVKFTRTEPDPITGVGSYSIRAQVLSATGMTTNIFMLQVLPTDTSGNDVAMFSHVASMADIARYPETTPDDAEYYRVNDIKLIVYSSQWLDKVEDLLKNDIQYLLDCERASEDESDSSSSSSSDGEIVVF